MVSKKKRKKKNGLFSLRAIYTPNFWAEKSGKMASYTQVIRVYDDSKLFI